MLAIALRHYEYEGPSFLSQVLCFKMNLLLETVIPGSIITLIFPENTPRKAIHNLQAVKIV